MLNVSSSFFVALYFSAFTDVSIHKKHARRGCEAAPVRGHSAPRYAGLDRWVAKVGGWSVARHLSRPLLTPARWLARSEMHRISGPIGLGEAVPSGTVTELVQNQQHAEIATFYCAVPWFPAPASRHVCAYACGPARTCGRSPNRRTTEPYHYIVIYEWFSGSALVLGRFPSRTALYHTAERLTLSGEYQGNLSRHSICGLFDGRRAKSFGDFRRVGGTAGVDRRNGGIPPFRAARSAPVGRVKLEGWAARRGFASVWRSPPLSISLTRSARGGFGTATEGGAAPTAPRAIPRVLAHETGRISIGLRHRQTTGDRTSESGAGPILNWANGSGSGWLSNRRAMRGMGLGGCAAGKLRRDGHATAGGGYVN